VIVILVVYIADLIWKILQWRKFSGGMPLWSLLLALTVRFVFMGGLLFVYLRRTQQPPQKSN